MPSLEDGAESTVQSPESGVHSPESGVHGPESTVRSPQSGVRSPEGDLLAGLPWVRRLPTPVELKAVRVEAEWNPMAAETLRQAISRIRELVEAAAADDHDVVDPTHLAEINGKPVGYASIEPVAMINLWSHTANKPRVSLQMLNMVENEAARQGFGTVIVPCRVVSPFYRLLDSRLGYKKKDPAAAALFIKNLR